jgi:exocyst complex component 2
MAPPPVVTGLSPNEGLPGTRITIRGENFGSKPTDLIGLSICGFDCLLSAEWKTPNKIIAISGPVKGKGEVIVTTRYGGVGTCSVTFKGYHETIGPMKESAVWVEETTPLFVWGRHSLSPSSYQQEDPLGLSVEGNEKKFPEEDLMSYFPEKSGDIAANNFSAGWFLLENHHATSFNDLQAGYLEILYLKILFKHL